MSAINEIKNIGDASRKTGVDVAGLGKNLGNLKQKLSELAYVSGRTSTLVSDIFKAPLGISGKFIGFFNEATKSVANFQNAVYLGGQRLSTFSSEFKTTAQSAQVYRNAIDKAKEGTRLTTLESEKLFKTITGGFKGIQTQKIVNDFASIQNQAAKLGGTLEEISDITNKVGSAAAKYTQLREAISSGDYGRAERLAGLLSQRGSIDYGQYEAIARLAKRGMSGEGKSERGYARNQFESERAFGQAQFDIGQAIGKSNVAQTTLTAGGKVAGLAGNMANTPGYGNAAAGLGLVGHVGSFFTGAGLAGGLAGGLTGGGISGGSGLGVSPNNPMYVSVVNGGGVGSGIINTIAPGISSGVGAGTGVAVAGGSGAAVATGAGIIAAGASVVASAAALGQMTKDLMSGGTGDNFIYQLAVKAKNSILGIKEEVKETSKEIGDSGVGGELDSITAKLQTWQNNQGMILESLGGIKDIYSQLGSVVGSNVGYSTSAAKFAEAQAEAIKSEIPILQQKLSILKEQYDIAISEGDETEALMAKEAMLKIDSQIYTLTKNRADSELKSKTTVLDAQMELQKQEVSLSKIIRDRNIEARLGMGISYSDQLDIIKDVAAQIPVLESKMQSMLQQAAKERESGNMEAALDFEKQAKDVRIEIEQTKIDFFKESKSIREGYLDAFKENVFGAGGFAKILPKVGSGNQFFADIAPLGGTGRSAIDQPGKYTTGGLQVSGGYGQTVDYLNRGVNAHSYGALMGAEQQGGLDPLKDTDSGKALEKTADATKRTDQTMKSLFNIVNKTTGGSNAVNVSIVGSGTSTGISGVYNSRNTGTAVSYRNGSSGTTTDNITNKINILKSKADKELSDSYGSIGFTREDYAKGARAVGVSPSFMLAKDLQHGRVSPRQAAAIRMAENKKYGYTDVGASDVAESQIMQKEALEKVINVILTIKDEIGNTLGVAPLLGNITKAAGNASISGPT